ncbi:hypothetical protein ACS0TY_034400 [Phlomoides rotata]
MAHNTSHRRTLAVPVPETPPMDPTSRKPKSTAAAAKNHRHLHPLPDPTITPPSTIQNISHRFSKLYINHKKLVPNSLKPHPHPQPDPPKFLEKKHLSCTTLTKSSSQHERNGASMKKIVQKSHFLMREKDGIKKTCPKKEASFDEKKASKLMPKDEEIKGFQQGLEIESKGRNSLSSIPPNVGRRRSFCSSQVELADFLSCNGVKVVAVDMPPFMQIHAVDCARKTHDSLEKFTSKTLAFTLKKEFDGVYGPAWHCIVGTSFGSFVTHSVGGFMYFSMDQKLYILLFKTTVQRAE